MLGSLLGDTEWLAGLLNALCGTEHTSREPDDGVREALAETVLMLVRPGSWADAACRWPGPGHRLQRSVAWQLEAVPHHAADGHPMQQAGAGRPAGHRTFTCMQKAAMAGTDMLQRSAGRDGGGQEGAVAADAPSKLRTGYEAEEHPGVCEAMEHCATSFLSHSGSVEEVTDASDAG